MKKEISWKILIPLGLAIWLLAKVFNNVVIAGSMELIGFIIGIMGVINLFKKKKK